MLFHRKVQLKIDHYKKIIYYDKNQEMIQVIENENFRSENKKKNIEFKIKINLQEHEIIEFDFHQL
jgi:hypothetical protein